MRDQKAKLEWTEKQRLAVALCLAWACLLGATRAGAQAKDSTQKLASTRRLLTVEEGRLIVKAAWEPGEPTPRTRDCSHFVHEIYRNAGFEYPYMSSFEIYAGNKSFARVRFPHAGDLIVWPGHVGIVVDPLLHSFYSLMRSGLEEQDYETGYWKSRGRPRFYRYQLQNGGVLNATKTPAAPQISNNNRQPHVAAVMEERSSEEGSASHRPPKAASEPSALIYGPPAPAERAELAPAFEIPSSILIAAGSKPPTREEVAEGISQLSDAIGNVLRSDDPFKARLPLVIIEQFSVERVEIKRDHGWARLQVDSKVSLEGGATQLKWRKEKIRWELRHTELGWEAVTPPDRSYVSYDVAVRNLAAQLARLTASDGAAAHLGPVLRQESQLASLLSTLLASH